MQIIRPPAEMIPFGLRTLKMVAVADGELAEAERGMLEAAHRIFGGADELAVDALTPITPEELAAHLPLPAMRRQIVRGMVVMSLVDGEASPEEAAVVEAFARGLGVESPDLGTLRLLADKHLMRARFDIGRRFWAREKAIEMAKERGIGWVARTLAAIAGVRVDREMSARYRALEHAPAGSLGRAYYDFITSRDFSFPGEKGSPPETIIYHDLTHVLSGYGTTPEGELQVLSFHAGCRREEKDPFSFVLFAIAEFHIGLSLSPLTTAERGHMNVEQMFLALERGSASKIDPTEGWDAWAVMNRPLEELRAEYAIPPIA